MGTRRRRWLWLAAGVGVAAGAGHALVASEVLPGPIAADVIKVIDGDTLPVRARIWLGQEVEINVRLADVDTPELCGAAARPSATWRCAPAAWSRRRSMASR